MTGSAHRGRSSPELLADKTAADKIRAALRRDTRR
jgi:hypothetical protein